MPSADPSALGTRGRSLFLVASPLQLLNAIEARHAFSEPSPVLVLYLDGYTREDFGGLMQEDDWAEVHALEAGDDVLLESIAASNPLKLIPPLARVLVDRKRRKLLDALNTIAAPIDRLYLGNYRPMFRHVANSHREAQVLLLDDGTATLQTNYERWGNPPDEQDSPLSRLRGELRRLAVGQVIKQVPEVTFFTTYDLELSPPDKLVKNDYGNLRRMMSNAEVSDEVYFLGQPLAEAKYTTLDTYIRYLGDVVRWFAGKHVIYLPHKREGETIERVRSELGLPIKSFQLPIEAALLVGSQRPAIVSSFHSSALENLGILFGKELSLISFYMHPDDLLDRRKSVEDIYDYFRKTQQGLISVVEATSAPGS